MSEKQTTLVYTLDDSKVSITVARATAKIGVQRYLLASKGAEENKDEDEALKILRLMFYPDLICATIEVEGMKFPISFEELIELPEDLVNKWAEAVYSVNPQWRPGLPDDAPLQKKKTRR